jgi:hypothetical protein
MTNTHTLTIGDVLQDVLNDITESRVAQRAEIQFDAEKYVRVAGADGELRRALAVAMTAGDDMRQAEEALRVALTAGFSADALNIADLHQAQCRVKLLTTIVETLIRAKYDLYLPDGVGIVQDGEDIIVVKTRVNKLDRLSAMQSYVAPKADVSKEYIN